MDNGRNIKFNKIALLSAIIFIISPFLAIPFILLGIINKSKFSLQLMALLFGIVGYIYIPNLSDDKARYFELYENFKDSSFIELFAYLMLQGQDFIFQSMFYWASQMNISAQYVFLIVTLISMSLILSVYYKITVRIPATKEYRFYFIILFFLALPYIDLFSGTRFMFAAAFILMGFYIGLIDRRKIAFLLLLTASFIHFSTLVFIPVFCVLFFFPNHNVKYRLFFLMSLLFLVLPSSVILYVFDMIGLSGGLAVKKDAYLTGDDFVQNALDESYINRIIFSLEMLWICSMYIFLFFFSKINSLYKNIVLFTAGIINLFFSIPTIFFRYALILKLLFVFLLIAEIYVYRQKLWVYYFGSILICIFFFQIISGLPNIVETYFNKDVLLSFSIFYKKHFELNDFIQ